MEIRPIGDKIIVQAMKDIEVKVGAIVVKADNEDLRIGRYKIFNAGSTQYKKNDIVYIYKYALMKLKPGQEELYVIRESEIVAVEVEAA